MRYVVVIEKVAGNYSAYVPDLPGLTSTYFVSLTVTKGSNPVSRNFYWLSSTADALAWDKSTWYYTPTTRHADLTALASLPRTNVQAEWSMDVSASPEPRARVTIANTGRALAFQVRLKALDASGTEMSWPRSWRPSSETSRCSTG